MTFVVAEIGINWDGDFSLLEKMIIASKKAGCDAIKFQAFNMEIVKAHPESARLMRSSITNQNIKQIDKISNEIGIEWFATPMYLDAVELLDPYVKRFKIREFDGRKMVKNEPSELFEKVLGTKKEIMISSEVSPKDSKFYGRPDIKWLYCVPKYPCDLSEVNFANIKEFDGYSNHVPKIIAPLTSVLLGAKIVEVHVTMDKKGEFIDNEVSFDFDELSLLVSMIRESENIKR
ncbi:MAG: N-acetylneuraminate synthase family protein [Nitrosarchaeum sp.]|nr:N-acetylneuraminate synthase family protein [Nitrosarchaeum sp.]MCA9819713.1 N-acetylneuraminate synthase family protein [Nitrosarchaeum sp.]